MATIKKPIKKAQNGTLTKRELDALSHQRRGMGQQSSSFVKKPGKIMNELGYLTEAQSKQLKQYMDKAGTAKKIYEALPNVGRMFGSSAADIPKGSQLEKQKKGGVIKKKMKAGGLVKKAKSGGSFPDLNKDGKITKADILKGRGVIAKKGAALKKQAAVAIAMKKAGKTPKTMKSGGKMKKCAYGCK